MSRDFCVIVNRTAGGGRAGRQCDGVLEELERRGVSCAVEITESPKHASQIAHDAADRGDRKFISVGGDGTASEVVNGLFAAGVSEACELGMVPLGTGNSFLRDFGITSVDDALAAVERGRSRPIDVLRLEHTEGKIHFINTMGTGFVARAGELTNEHFKFLGAAGYIAAVLICIANLRYERNTLRYGDDLDDEETVLTSFSNSQFTGGAMKMAPHADVADGLLDVVRAGRLSRGALTAAFGKIFKGTHVDLDTVWTRQVERVELVDAVPQPVLIDGDLFHLTPLSVEVVPSSLRFIA